MILVYSDHETGQVALSSTLIEGIAAELRTYDIVNHLIEVDGGGSDIVAQHDAKALCHRTGYRLATPNEANDATKNKRKTGSLVETKPGHGDPIPLADEKSGKSEDNSLKKEIRGKGGA